jgi:hypothetical protein
MIAQVRELKSHLMFVFLAVILLGQTYPAMAQPDTDHIVINEVDINPPGDDSKSVIEWVELYNPTNQTMDIGGWIIGATSGLKTTYKVPTNTQLKSGGFLTYTFGPLWFPDASATIQLKDKNGIVVDQTQLLADAENNLKSWQRTADGLDTDSKSDWAFRTSNAGSSNGKISSTATQTFLTINVETDMTNYIFGETVKITGQVSKKVNVSYQSYTAEEINLVISGPSGFERKFVLYPDNSLSFKTDFRTDKVLKVPEGDYKVSAEYAGATSEAIFSVGEKEFVPPERESSASISITTDKLEYIPGQQVIINANTSKIIPFAGMQFKVFNPNGKQVHDGTLYPDTKGKFSVQLFINPVNPVFGTYDVIVTYDTATSQTTYKVTPENKETQAISLTTNKKVYGLGDTVVITGRQNKIITPTLEIQITQPFVSKQITDTFVIKDLLRTSDFGGDGTFRYEFKIPVSKQRLGDYTVKVNARSVDSSEVIFKVVENPEEFVDVQSLPLTIDTDKSSYTIGDLLVISGKLSVKQNIGKQTVGIVITDSGGKPIISIGEWKATSGKKTETAYSFTAVPDSTGNFEIKTNIYRQIFQKGEYSVKATYGKNTAFASFSVTDPAEKGSGVKIIASTDKEVYGIGEIVQLTGKVSTFTAQTAYEVTLTDPNGKQTSDGVIVDNSKFSWSWTIPSYGKIGVYKITVSSDSDETNVYFKVSDNPESDSVLLPITVETDRAVYSNGDTITISGQAISKSSSTTSGSIVNIRPQITIKTDANKIVYSALPDITVGGKFQASFKVVPNVFKAGEYKVTASYYDEKAQTVFRINDNFGTGDVPLALLMETDKDKYLPGETVKISGKTSKIISVFEVDVTVSKTGEEKNPVSIRFDQSGSFNYDFVIPQTNSLGTYTVKADTDFDTIIDTFEVVSELPQESVEEPINATPQDTGGVAVKTKITDKVNRITDSDIPILIETKDIDGTVYTPRMLDGLLRVNPGDNSVVNLKVTFDGTCIIGPDSGCKVKKSTRDGSSLYQIVKVNDENLRIRYSGPNVGIEKFTILPEDANAMIPNGDWNVEIIKDKQISRFYYKISYTAQ